MNIAQIKILSWTGAGLLTLGLSYYVWDYVSHMQQRSQLPDPKLVKQVLEDVEPLKVKAEEVVAYGNIKRLFHTTCSECKTNPNCRHLNWTGKEKEIVVATPDSVVEAPKVKVDELVSVLMIKADMADRKNSSIFFKYKNKATNVGLNNNGPTGGFVLKEGEHLGAPYDKVRLDEITGDAVYFAFEGEEREREKISPGTFEVVGPVAVGPGGEILPKTTGLVPSVKEAPFSLQHTTKIGSNLWQIGTEDANYFAVHYQEELTRNVQTSRHQDRRTGKYDGIAIDKVTPGSIAAGHGAQEGDVIKSINGQPVTSVQEAIHYVKTHSDQTTTWEVVVESKGITKTVIYHSPSN
ncbi:MAG: PDZ domain-containing protein [Planctomycetes bacterium]|nr:PDZ domain-containing protein [Planctomycetota bacterium]